MFAEFDCVMISVMVLCDQPWLAFVCYDCAFSDQVLDVQKKHGVVRFHSKCTYMKIQCLKYVVMCTCFAHARSVNCRFVSQPGLAHW